MSNAPTRKHGDDTTERTTRPRKGKDRVPLSLPREAREVTQAQLAKRGRMTVAEVAWLEAGTELARLQRYAKALDGTAEVALVIGDRRYPISLAVVPKTDDGPPSEKSLREIPELDWSKAKRVTRRLKATASVPTHQSLSEMRQMVSSTQADVAKAMGTNQAEISRLEARSDNVFLSTLKRYAEAIGCRCEVAFVFPRGDWLFLQNEDAARVVEDE